jgi:hypothetical protein
MLAACPVRPVVEIERGKRPGDRHLAKLLGESHRSGGARAFECLGAAARVDDA